ncbi:MAG TPA: FtsX-like permease family protein, partial [Bdellovibrio sp.]
NEGVRKLGIEAWLGSDQEAETVKKDLLNFSDVVVETWMDRNSALLYALKLEKLTIGTFLALAGIIAASSILTVLALLLSQKRRDIAILRTIGFSAKQTVQTFTLLGLSLASVGVLTGVILGTAIGLYIEANPLRLVSSEIYYDPSLPALVDFHLVFGVLLVSAIVAWLGSYIPARTAADVQPSDALRIK